MPVRTTTVDRQRTLAGLAKSVFDAGSRPEAIERAVAALRHANPQLGGDAAPKSGMTLFVPKVEGIKFASGKAGGADVELANLALERARSLAELAGKPLETAVAAAEERAKDTRSPDTVKHILGARPGLQEEINIMQEGAAREVERIKAQVTEFRAIIESAVHDLEKRRSTIS